MSEQTSEHKKRQSDLDQSTEYQVSDDPALNLALQIDATVRQVRPDDWRGVEPRERVIKKALFDVLNDVAEAERIFLIIAEQKEY